MTLEDARRRFFAPIRELGPALARRLANPDPEHDVAFAALPLDGDHFLGVGRLAGVHRVAEFAIAVRSDAQGRGLGHLLLSLLIERAKLRGFSVIEGEVLRDNERMLQMCRDFGFKLDADPSESTALRVTKHLSAIRA